MCICMFFFGAELLTKGTLANHGYHRSVNLHYLHLLFHLPVLEFYLVIFGFRDRIQSLRMDPSAAQAPGLISSLDAMIQATCKSLFDRRVGANADTLDAQIQAAVTAALNKRLGPEIGSLGNRMASLIEQRLGSAVSIVNHRVDATLTAALDQRLGPTGSALTAQITFTPAASSLLPSVTPPKAQNSGEANETKENNGTCPAAEQLVNTQPVGSCGAKEKKNSPKKQNATKSGASKMATPELLDELSAPAAISGESNEQVSTDTDATQPGALQSGVYSLLANNASQKKGRTSSALTSKPNAKSQGPASSADKIPTKRNANQKNRTKKVDDSGESASSSSGESDKETPKRKRPKVKLDPPGYTNGPAFNFRRVSPLLTASTRSRGNPRVIELRSFTEESNKQNLTMADVVATVLFNHDPKSLNAFMDMDSFPTFRFLRKQSDRKARDFVIERRRESYGVVVKVSGTQLIVRRTDINVMVQCGYHLSQAERAKYRSDPDRVWETKYEYIILPIGRWVASSYMQEPTISNSSKRTIEQWATEFGTKVLLGKFWVEGSDAKIESDKLVLPWE